MVKIKICGMQTSEEVKGCSQLDIDALGFITEYPSDVPWNLDKEKAKKLIDKVPPFVNSVLVTIGSPNEVLELMDFTNADTLQLHGKEDIDVVQEITKKVHFAGKKIIKSVYLSEGLNKVIEFEEIGVDAILIDSNKGDRSGGTGKKVNWKRAKKFFDAISIPSILAGGLTPHNISEGVSVVKPFAVDVITGIEDDDHRKSTQKIKKFIKNSRS